MRYYDFACVLFSLRLHLFTIHFTCDAMIHHYSSLQYHTILQKSFQYADLVLINVENICHA